MEWADYSMRRAGQKNTTHLEVRRGQTFAPVFVYSVAA